MRLVDEGKGLRVNDVPPSPPGRATYLMRDDEAVIQTWLLPKLCHLSELAAANIAPPSMGRGRLKSSSSVYILTKTLV